MGDTDYSVHDYSVRTIRYATIRYMDYSVHGLFGTWTIRYMDYSVHDYSVHDNSVHYQTLKLKLEQFVLRVKVYLKLSLMSSLRSPFDSNFRFETAGLCVVGSVRCSFVRLTI